MVRMGNPAAAPPDVPAAVKVEVEDPSDEAYAPANKRSKLESGAGTRMIASHPMPYNLLDEPSPLGLRLRKSPSLLDLIQMRISQVSSVAKSCITNCENSEVMKKDLKSSAVSATSDKMKASNFPASLLRIGTWERASKYEGDLVAKCYFAKHKLVWEVLENGLKSKIEIQWSDITALKATCPENGHSTLDIVLARQPLFFRETNPQPRKHTLWQVTEDFTGGQASAYRRHILQCPPGLLDKHFEKLIQCDQRLNSLSQQPDIILESPYFESQCSVFEDQDESKSHSFINLHGASESKISRFPDPRLPSGASLACIKSELRDPVDTSCLMVKESASPCSVMDSRATDGNSSSETDLKDPNSQEKFNVPGLRASISMSDLVNHIGHCISEKFDSGNAQLSDIGLSKKSVLEEISQYLFTDSQISAPDEQSLMSRVNSFCCLLQKDSSEVQNLQVDVADSEADEDDDEEPVLTQGSNSKRQEVLDNPATVRECVDASVCKQQLNMSRKDSFGDLLLHLPRIASLPQFLFNIIEDSEEQSS